MLFDFLSPYIIAIVVAWLVAHAIKYTISLINSENVDIIRSLFVSGGMPSSHSATVVSLVTIIGFIDGPNSGLFGLSILFAMITMYDAMKVRRSSGEQGVALRKLMKEQKSTILTPYVVKGHTPIEVLAGAVLGLVIGVVVFFATK